MAAKILAVLSALAGAVKTILGYLQGRRLIQAGRDENARKEAHARENQARAAAAAGRDTSSPDDFSNRVRRRGW